jgi:hypothetical protein
MLAKLLGGAVITGILLVATAPLLLAQDAPKTKEDCAKLQDMKWDDATQTCIKK